MSSAGQNLETFQPLQGLLGLAEHGAPMGGAGGHKGRTFRRFDAHLLDAVLNPGQGGVVEGLAGLGKGRVDHRPQEHSQRLIDIC